MPVPYIPLAIANEFIAKTIEDGGIHHMKLQKLCFLVMVGGLYGMKTLLL